MSANGYGTDYGTNYGNMTEPELPDNVLSGAFYRLATVAEELTDTVLDDIKTGAQTITYIGNTHDGFETDLDWDEYSVNPSSGAVTQQFRSHVGYTLTCNTFATPGLEQLEEAELVDTSTGQIIPKNLIEGVLVEVFDQDPRVAIDAGEDEVETIVFPNADITIDGLDYGESDAGEYPLEITVNDHPYVMSYRDEPV